MYQIGDYVVYGNKGVCEVKQIAPMEMSGISNGKMYYTLVPIYREESKIYTPVDHNKTSMRSVISKEDAFQLMHDLEEIKPLEIENEKNLEQVYKDCMNSFNCKDMMKVIKTIYVRQSTRILDGKKLIATDEKYLKIAKECLIGELSIPLKKTPKDLEEEIRERL